MNQNGAVLLDYDEDIDVNEFFVHMQSVYPQVFKDASTKRYTICVPRQGSFDVKTLTKEVIETHILKTRLDHQDIRATILTYSGKEVKLANGNLETISGFEFDKKIKVLFEVDYVNEAEHSYKVLCIDMPLEGDSWSHVTNGELFTQRLITREQCMDFLWVSRKLKVKRRVDLLVAPVINQITAAETSDQVLNSCRRLYNQALTLLLHDPYFRKYCRSNYYFYEAVQLSLETYLMGLLHDSVFSRLYNLHKADEIEFNKQFLFFSDKVTYRTLQLEKKHCVNLDKSSVELEQLSKCQCPLEMGFCLDRVTSLLSYSAPTATTGGHRRTGSRNNTQPAAAVTRQNSSENGTRFLKSDTVVISADELLPLLVLLILKSRVPCWLTILNYLTNYRLSEKVSSRVCYAITTFEAAILFIRNGYLKEEYERELTLLSSASPSASKQLPHPKTKFLLTQSQRNRTLGRPNSSSDYSVNGERSKRKQNKKKTESKKSDWSSNSLTNIASPSDDTDSGVAPDDVIATSNIDDLDSEVDRRTLDGLQGAECEDEAGAVQSEEASGSCSEEEDADSSSLFGEESMLVEEQPSPIERLFEYIKEDRREEMNELLENEKELLIETLCHPLCDCAKCVHIKAGSNVNVRGSSSDDCSPESLFPAEKKVSSSSRDERGWTALHAAAFYGNQFALEKLVNLDYAVSSKNNQGLTPLHLACIEGHQNICMLLLYYNAPVNAPDKEGNTGLHIACLKGHFHVVTALLYQQGAEPLNINAQNVLQETPLLLASKFGYIEIVRELLDNGADVGLENSVGEAPLQVCLDNDIRLLLLGGSQSALTRWNDERALLVSQQLTHSTSEMDMSSVADNDSPTASTSSMSFERSSTSRHAGPLDLSTALGKRVSPRRTYSGDSDHNSVSGSVGKQSSRVRGGVFASGASSEGNYPDSVKGGGGVGAGQMEGSMSVQGSTRRSEFSRRNIRSASYTCLSDEHENPSWFHSHQSKQGHDRKLRLLLQKVRANEVEKVLFLLGAASRVDRDHPIVFAHSLCHPKCDCEACDQLRKDARNPPHRYTLTVNSQTDASEGGLSALHAAVISGLPEMCVVLLNQGASVDKHAPPSMNTPLHFACQYNRAEIASLLFEYGANGNIPNREQNTALHLAASCGHEWPVNLLASVSKVNLNARNMNGNTPLHLAASHGHIEVTKCLLDAGADPNVRNDLTLTPVELAILGDHQKIATLLGPMTLLKVRTVTELEQTEKESKLAARSGDLLTNGNVVASEDVSMNKQRFSVVEGEEDDVTDRRTSRKLTLSASEGRVVSVDSTSADISDSYCVEEESI